MNNLDSFTTRSWSKVILLIVVIILVVSNIVFVKKYVSASRRAELAEASVLKTNLNAKILDFTNLFIEQVLQGKGEISFDERLVMETSVKDLKDQEISAQWRKFVESNDERTAQVEVTNLLKLLINKARN